MSNSKKIMDSLTAEQQAKEATDPSAEATPALERSDYEALENKLTEAEAKATEHWNQFLRAQAEAANIRQRAELEIEKAFPRAIEQFARELLPVGDSLERGLEKTTDELESVKAMREGISLTLDLFLKTLEKFGIRQLNPQGEPFNPEQHQAMATEEQPGSKPNAVLRVLQKGYLLHDRVIRPALVVVTK